MAVAYQAVGTAVSATTGTLSVPWPASHAIDDVALLFVESSAGGTTETLSTPSGFVGISTQSTGTGTAGTKLTIFWCRATSTTMANPVVAAGTDHKYGVIVTYRGAINSGNPYNIFGGGVKASASTSTTITGITSTVANSLIVGGITKDLDSTAAFLTNRTNANLTSLATRFDAGTQSGGGGGIAVWEGYKATAGATGSTTATVTSSINAFISLALTPQPVAISQTAYRFYEDGSESASVAIAAQNTDITRDVTYDSSLQARIRLQETNGADGISTDDYTLEYSLNGAKYVNVNEKPVIDANDDTELISTGYTIYGGAGYNGRGQAFTGNGRSIVGAGAIMAKTGSPTGTFNMRIYAHSGTWGSSSVPTGSALAVSDDISTSVLSTTPAMCDFIFSGANSIQLVDGTRYVLTIEYSLGDASNNIIFAAQSGFATFEGNLSSRQSTNPWVASDNFAHPFFIYSSSEIVVSNFDSLSTTDGGATTNRLGAGTGSFLAGKVSEDGSVDNFQLTASNYTELLYAVKILSDGVANNETIDFRVYRNTDPINTYTVTPRITVTKSEDIYQDITFDAASSSAFDGATTTFAHTTSGSDRLLVVAVAMDTLDSADAVSSITYAGVAMTQIVTYFNVRRVYLYYLLNPALGTNNIVVNFNADGDYGVMAASYNGVLQSSPLDGTATASDDDTTPYSKSITTTNAKSLVVFAAADTEAAANTRTPSSGSNERHDVILGSGAGDFGGFFSDQITTGPGTYTLSYTEPNVSGSTQAITAFKPALLTGGSTAGYVKLFIGEAWVAKPRKVFNGTTWDIKPVKVNRSGTWGNSNG